MEYPNIQDRCLFDAAQVFKLVAAEYTTAVKAEKDAIRQQRARERMAVDVTGRSFTKRGRR